MLNYFFPPNDCAIHIIAGKTTGRTSAVNGRMKGTTWKSKVLMQRFNALWPRCIKSCLHSSAYRSSARKAFLCIWMRLTSDVWPCTLLLVEVFACSRDARQLLVEDIFLGAHTITFHVLCPVELTHIKIEHLQHRRKEQAKACVRV